MVNRSRPSSSRISQDTARPAPTAIDGPRIPPPDFGVPQEASTESIGGGTQVRWPISNMWKRQTHESPQSSTWEGDDEFRSLLQYLPSTQGYTPLPVRHLISLTRISQTRRLILKQPIPRTPRKAHSHLWKFLESARLQAAALNVPPKSHDWIVNIMSSSMLDPQQGILMHPSSW